MRQTDHYNFNLPEGEDRVDIDALNANSEVLDTVLFQVQGKAEAPVDYNQILNPPNALPASDVYPWAKASNKPTYTADEVGTLDTSQITMITDELSDRIDEVAQQAANVDAITADQINSLFDTPSI
jgi:hypothetical protein